MVIPRASEEIAPFIPDSVKEQMSRQMEKTFAADQTMIHDRLDKQASLRFYAAVREIQDHFPEHHFNIQIVSDSNPNAFILPNGHIFMTTKLVEISEKSDELVAVLLHEMGHHVYSHAVSSFIENATLSMLVFTLTGGMDWTGLPLLALLNSYSRDKERQADAFAVQHMQLMEKDPNAFADIFEKMEKTPGSISGVIPTFLSTHPSTEERVRRIR